MHPMFSVHTTLEKFENATITGYFGFVFDENSTITGYFGFVFDENSNREIR